MAKWYCCGLAQSIGTAIALLIIPPQVASAQVEQYVTGQPFTISMMSIQQDSNGLELNRQTTLFARNFRGSTVEWRTPLAGAQSGNRIVVNLESHQRIAIDVITESLTTYRLSSDAIELIKQAQVGCSNKGKSENIFGMDVFKINNTRRLGTNSFIHTEQWISPALGCFALREIKTQVEDGDIKSRNTTEMLSFSVGEPSPEVFDIPSSYVERSPSQVFMELARRRPDVCPGCMNNATMV